LKTDFFRADHSVVATWRMPKRSSKKKDINETAFSIVQQATGKSDPAQVPPEKNPAAVSLGKLGGLKGGAARAIKLTPERRKEISRKAALARWGKKN
jgi:hypothetical protein